MLGFGGYKGCLVSIHITFVPLPKPGVHQVYGKIVLVCNQDDPPDYFQINIGGRSLLVYDSGPDLERCGTVVFYVQLRLETFFESIRLERLLEPLGKPGFRQIYRDRTCLQSR